MRKNRLSDSEKLTKERFTPSRRTIVKSAALLGLVGGIGSRTTAQEFEETFVLGGQRSGWEGVSPASIEGETNPTLEVVVGRQYQLTWENLDGAVHNFAILNEDDDIVQASEFMSDQGAEQEVTFTVEENFSQYICEPHSGTMRGDFEIVEEGATEETTEQTETEGTETTEQAETTEEEERQEPNTVFQFDLREKQWCGLAPEEIKDESNPTLQLNAGETYAIVWTLRTERPNHQTGHNLVIYDEEGNHLASTGFLMNEGTSRTLLFTAESEMTSYSDQTQLGVGGEIEVSEAGDG